MFSFRLDLPYFCSKESWAVLLCKCFHGDQLKKCEACFVVVTSSITQLARHVWQTNANKMNGRISIWHLSEMFASSCVPSCVWSRCYYVYPVIWLNHKSHTSNIIYMIEFKVQCTCRHHVFLYIPHIDYIPSDIYYYYRYH